MDSSIDILGLGYTAVDELLYVDAYPAADAKAPVRRRQRQCGGLTATALVAAARMGCRCAYAGTLGDDELSQFAIERFHEEGVVVDHVRTRCDARPVHSTIIIDQDRQTRTIFYDLDGVVGPDATWPPKDLILAAKLLLVDHCNVEGMIRAAEIARDAGIPVVGDIENAANPRILQLLAVVDHLILSCAFALKLTGARDPSAAVQALWTVGRRAAVVTCGQQGCWYICDEQPGITRHLPALAVDAIDTTGCGDVFHGAYAAALVLGLKVPDALRFATVAAGLKAAHSGGQAGIPTRSAVEEHLTKASSDRAWCSIGKTT